MRWQRVCSDYFRCCNSASSTVLDFRGVPGFWAFFTARFKCCGCFISRTRYLYT